MLTRLLGAAVLSVAAYFGWQGYANWYQRRGGTLPTPDPVPVQVPRPPRLSLPSGPSPVQSYAPSVPEEGGSPEPIGGGFIPGGGILRNDPPEAVEYMAKTLWGEARGENQLGRIAVASVIMNRVAAPNYPNTVKEVCIQRAPGSAYGQFSAWNPGDPNRAKMMALTIDNNGVYRELVDLARDVIAGAYDDPTGGALHYWAPKAVPGGEPWWMAPDKSPNARVTLRTGGHVFAVGVA